MPATRNLRVRNAHRTTSNPPLLTCALDNCTRSFRSKSSLTKHIRASHQHAPETRTPEPGPSRLPLPKDSLLHCSSAGCDRSFKNRAGLTKHTRLYHPQSLDPVQSGIPHLPDAYEESRPSMPNLQLHHHLTPLQAPSSSTHLPTDKDQTFTQGGGHIFMPGSPLHHRSPSPRSSSTHLPIEEDQTFTQDGDHVFVAGSPLHHRSPLPPSSPTRHHMDEGHPFTHDDGVIQGSSANSRRASTPSNHVNLSYHPLINGK
jgi:hypothetical protein